MSEHERLSKELRNRATETGGHPISFDDVKRSARKMRRQQLAVSGGIAAVVLAIGVPVGFAMVNDDATSGPGFADGTPTPTVATPTESPTTEAPGKLKKVALDADTEQGGGEPAIPYVIGQDLILPTGDLINTPVKFHQFTDLGDGWVGIATDEAASVVYFLDAAGEVQRKVTSQSYSIATSADHTLVAYTDGENKLHVAWGPEESSSREMPSTTPTDIAGVLGTTPCQDPPSSDAGCAVIYESTDDQGEQTVRHSTSNGGDTEAPRLLSVGGLVDLTQVAGMVSVTDDGSCSSVGELWGDELWKTCEYSLGSFSPDRRYVIGHPAYRDGIGDGMVAVLDAETGKPIAQFDTDTQGGSFINDVVWESDDSLLAMVYDDGWALMRLGVDGSLGNVSKGRIAGEPEEVPVHFPVG